MPKGIRPKIESELYSNNSFNNTLHNSLLKMDIDQINLRIVEELLNNPDIKSSDLAKKLQIPLSTLQRRRTLLEKSSVLKKIYWVDLQKFKLRTADIFINSEGGQSNTIVEDLKNQNNKNILSVSYKIGGPQTHVSIKVIYKDSVQLFKILENIKTNPLVTDVDWHESVLEEKNKNSSFIDVLFDN